MYTSADAVALVVACLFAAAVVISVQLSRRSRHPREVTAFLGAASGAAVAAVGSSVMYLTYVDAQTRVALIGGDAAMVLGPGLFWIALRMRAGRSWRALAAPVAAALVVAVVTTFVPQPASTAVKMAAVGAFCLMFGIAALRAPLRGSAGAGIVATVGLGYAVFAAARLLTGAVAGVRSPLFEAMFSIRPTTIVGGTAVALLAVGVWRMLRTPEVGAPAATDGVATAEGEEWEAEIIDSVLIRRTLGSDEAVRLQDALERACAAHGTIVDRGYGRVRFRALAPDAAERVLAAYRAATGVGDEGAVGAIAIRRAD